MSHPLPKEIMDKFQEEAKVYADSLDRAGCSYYNGLYRGRLDAALHYSQIIEDLKKEVAFKKNELKIVLDDMSTIINKSTDKVIECDKLQSEIEELKAENEVAVKSRNETIEAWESIKNANLKLKAENERLKDEITPLLLLSEANGDVVNGFRTREIIIKLRTMLNSEQKPERSVATEVDSSNVADDIKDYKKLGGFYISQLREKHSEISKLQSQIKALLEGLEKVKNRIDVNSNWGIAKIIAQTLTNYYNSIK